jgi:hypothetical protein
LIRQLCKTVQLDYEVVLPTTLCSVGSGAQRWEIVPFQSTLPYPPRGLSFLVGLVSSLSLLVCFVLPVILHFRPRVPLFCRCLLNRAITSSPHHRYTISLRLSSSLSLMCRCLADPTRHVFTLLTPFLCFAYLSWSRGYLDAHSTQTNQPTLSPLETYPFLLRTVL